MRLTSQYLAAIALYGFFSMNSTAIGGPSAAIEQPFTDFNPFFPIEHPLAGFWKEGTCEWDGSSGIRGYFINPTAGGEYQVHYCGGGVGCFRSRIRPFPVTRIVDDPLYRVIDSSTIEIASINMARPERFARYVKCGYWDFDNAMPVKTSAVP